MVIEQAMPDLNSPEEQWRAAVGYEGLYAVNDQGCIRSLDRVVESIHGITGTSYTTRRKGRILKPHMGARGHAYVVVGGGTRTVHSIVAEAFIGPRPPGGTHFHAGLIQCKRGHDLTDPDNLQKTAKGNRRTCLACRRDRQALYNAGSQVTVDGFCINGHPITPENRYTNGSGRSRCKPCANKRQRIRGA